MPANPPTHGGQRSPDGMSIHASNASSVLARTGTAEERVMRGPIEDPPPLAAAIDGFGAADLPLREQPALMRGQPRSHPSLRRVPHEGTPPPVAMVPDRGAAQQRGASPDNQPLHHQRSPAPVIASPNNHGLPPLQQQRLDGHQHLQNFQRNPVGTRPASDTAPPNYGLHMQTAPRPASDTAHHLGGLAYAPFDARPLGALPRAALNTHHENAPPRADLDTAPVTDGRHVDPARRGVLDTHEDNAPPRADIETTPVTNGRHDDAAWGGALGPYNDNREPLLTRAKSTPRGTANTSTTRFWLQA